MSKNKYKYIFDVRKTFYDYFTVKTVEAVNESEAWNYMRQWAYENGYTDYRLREEH